MIFILHVLAAILMIFLANFMNAFQVSSAKLLILYYIMNTKVYKIEYKINFKWQWHRIVWQVLDLLNKYKLHAKWKKKRKENFVLMSWACNNIKFILCTFFDRVKHALKRIQCGKSNILSICTHTFCMVSVCLESRYNSTFQNVNGKSRLTHLNSKQHTNVKHIDLFVADFFSVDFP